MKSSAKSLKDILQGLSKDNNWDGSFKLDYYRRNWKELLEPPLCNVTKPCKVYGKKLVIEVVDNYWKNEIAEHSEAFISKVNEAFKQYKIKYLQIK